MKIDSPNKTTDGYRICTKTIMDTSDPKIEFNKYGESNHFYDFKRYIEPRWNRNQGDSDRLECIVNEIKKSGKNAEFDCILGLSGGLDSSYMLHKLVSDYDLKPLVFHVDAGWNSEIAVSNINQIVDGLSLDLYTEVIDWDLVRDFQLSMFKSGVPHLDIPQDLAFVSVLYKFAREYKIKYILNGGNVSTESVLMPKEILYFGTDLVHLRDLLSTVGKFKLKDYPATSVFYHKVVLPIFYGVKVLKPLNLMRYIQAEAIQELQSAYGWRPYKQKHFESNFTRFFEGFWLPTRFGYDMRRNQFSSLILSNQLDRNQALEMLESPPLNDDEVMADFSYVASKLEISVDELWHYHAMEKKFYWDYRNQDFLISLGEKVLTRILGKRRGGAI